MNKIALIFFLQICVLKLLAQNKPSEGFRIIERPIQKQIDILWKGRLLTSYCYYDSIYKPFLYPVNTVNGITVTRGYPLKLLPGERTDHPHHTGVWMNYESVNGIDFWNNSTAIPAEKKNLYGTIVHREVLNKIADFRHAIITVSADWVGPDMKILLKEKTTYIFRVQERKFFIDRITNLTALQEKVVFKDVKDGFFAIRVARELEMPSKESSAYVDSHGNKTEILKNDTNGVTGMYYCSNGLRGDSVWSSKGAWAMLKGKKQGSEITIAMFDHPLNPGFPAYWHARGYGLFAINPLGRKIFSNGKDEFNYTLLPGSSSSFHYRMLITSEDMSIESINTLAAKFANEK